MTDMSKTIIPKSDQLNADDLIAGPRTITITALRGCEDADQPVAVHFEGDDRKPYKPCKSMRRVMVHAWGPDGNTYAGKRMTLFCDPNVVFGGIKVGGIRISHMSGIDRDMTVALTATRAQRKPYTVRPLPREQGGGSAGVDLRAILKGGRDAASRGSADLATWWGNLSKAERAAAKPTLDAELKTAAAAADMAGLDADDHDAETGEIIESDLPGHADEADHAGFGGDRPSGDEDEFDVETWARDLMNDDGTLFRTSADIKKVFTDPDAYRRFTRLKAENPTIARELESALKGKEKALLDRERAR